MFYNSAFQLGGLNNGILSARRAMPQKDITSDGDSSFAMGRRVYMDTEVQPSVLQKKKWYGGSSVRDSSVVMGKRVKNVVGNGTLNSAGSPMSFTSVKDVNVVRDALVRVRNIGSSAPAKKIHKYDNAPVFY